MQHNDKATRVQHLHGVLDFIQLFVGTGAQDHILGLPAVAAPALQDGGTAVCHPVDLIAGGLAVVGDDQRQHGGGEAEHHLVDDRRHNEVEHQTVDDGIHIVKHRTVEQDDRQCRTEGQVSEGQVGMFCLDGHGYEVDSTGTGVLHVDQGVANAADHTAADGGQQPVAGVNRHKGQQVVGEYGKQNHAAQAAQQEGTAQQLVAEKDDGHIDEHIAQAHGQAEQAVENGADAGHAGNRNFRRHGKAVDACGRNKAAQHFQQQVDFFILRHRRSSETERAGSTP